MSQLLTDYIVCVNSALATSNSIYRLKAGPNEMVEIVDVAGKPTHTSEDELDRWFTPSQETTDYIMQLVADEKELAGE